MMLSFLKLKIVQRICDERKAWRGSFINTFWTLLYLRRKQSEMSTLMALAAHPIFDKVVTQMQAVPNGISQID
jgi:hypothetical protein